MTTNIEEVVVDIVLEANKALIALSDLTSKTRSFSDQLNLARNVVKEFAAETGMGFDKAKKTLSDLDQTISGSAVTSTVFGTKGQEAWNKVGQSAESNSKLVVGGVDVIRRAVSFLIGQLLFQLLAAFQKVFTDAIDGLKKLETSFYNLANAEKAMSENGVNVTFKDLEATVDRLHTKFQGMFSKTELQDTVSQIALVTKNLGLNADQIEKIAATAATIQLANPDKTIGEIATTLTTSDLNGRLTSLAKLGVNIDEIKAKEAELAAQLGISTKDLTEQQKATIELEAAYESVTNGADALTGRENTLSGVQKQLSSAWQDLVVEIAKTYAPEIVQGFKLLINALQIILVLFKALEPAISRVVILIASLAAGMKGLGGLNPLDALRKFAKQFEVAKSDYQNYLNNAQDTPTGIGGSASIIDNSKLIEAEQKTEDELNKIFTENRDKRADIDLAYQQKLQDDALNNQQKLEDIATKEAQAIQDAYTNYNQKIQDIQISTQQKLTDNKKEAQQKEIDAEQKHQDELKRLRDKYLFDLEDALHNRDARQILKLMAQYQMDKAAADKSLQVEQAKIKQETQLKQQQILQDQKQQEAAAKRDLQRKLADIQLAASRERQAQAINYARQQADAQLNYQRQLQAQQVYLQRKLRDLATAIQQEYNLTAAGMAAINALIGSYAGLPTTTAGSGTMTTSSNPASANVSTSSVGSPVGNASSPSSVNGGLYTPPGGGLADGGSFLATTPTRINVAENRPELITATPLGRPGANAGKIFSQLGMGRGGGQIEVALTLSPDLEARVVRKSLDETANVVARINRSKV